MAAPTLDLSLPEAPQARRRGGFLPLLTLLVAATTLGLLLWQNRDSETTDRQLGAQDLEAIKKVAVTLEKRTLFIEAEAKWSQYMSATDLNEKERADTLYRRAKCLKEGGDYSGAAALLSELDAYPQERERKRNSRRLLLESLSALGKNEVRENLSRAFAMRAEEEEGSVVARVSNEDLTREELREELTAAAEELLKAQGVPLTPGELQTQAAALAARQLETPEMARQAVQQVISAKLLYREGLDRGYADEGQIGRAVERFRRQWVARRVIEAEQEKALSSLGPTELKNHYEANKATFVDKASTEFSFQRFESVAAATVALQGDAQKLQLQAAQGPAVAGAPLPGIGRAAELTAHILALTPGSISDRPVLHNGAAFIARADKKHPERQLTFEEAEARVRTDLAAIKQREALQALQGLLTQKYRVEILDASLVEPTDEAGSSDATSQNSAATDAKDSSQEKASGSSGNADSKTPPGQI